jgi:hypothetical protein
VNPTLNVIRLRMEVPVDDLHEAGQEGFFAADRKVHKRCPNLVHRIWEQRAAQHSGLRRP